MQQTDIKIKKGKTKTDKIKTERKMKKYITEKRKTDYQITVTERKTEGRTKTEMKIGKSQRKGNMMIGTCREIGKTV